MNTFEQIRAMIATEFGLDPSAVTAQTALVDLGIDSLAALEFAFALEDAFHVRLETDLDLKSARVADLVAAIDAAAAAQPDRVPG